MNRRNFLKLLAITPVAPSILKGLPTELDSSPDGLILEDSDTLIFGTSSDVTIIWDSYDLTIKETQNAL